MSAKEEKPEPGSVNEARTKACCYNCEEIFDFDPSWTAETNCPNCEERMFAFACSPCYWTCYSHASTTQSFPHQECDNCGTTNEEIEAEEQEQARHNEERERVKRAYEYRKRKQDGTYQNAIRHTFNSLRETDANKVWQAIRNPRNENDALRVYGDAWTRLRPFVAEEIRKRNLDPETYITKEWCQRLLSYFERTWLSENKEALECGQLEDCSGSIYMFLDRSELTCKLRELREGHAEEGAYPCCPAVRITQPTGDDPLTITWDLDPIPGTDPREIHKTDRDKELSLGEFILWSARFGGFTQHDYNPKYVISDSSDHTPEPIAYVPTEWVGKPKKWKKEVDQGYPHWRFWMVPMFGDGVCDWDGRKLSDNELRQLSYENMLHCCVCFGDPPAGQDLIECECGDRLYCSKTCQDKYMQVHKFDPTTLIHKSVTYTCFNCGDEKVGVPRCGKCKNAFFCDKECQKSAWSGTYNSEYAHKKTCCKLG